MPRILWAALFALPITSSPGFADCFSQNASERLENYCAFNSLEGSVVSLPYISHFENRLVREGYSLGLQPTAPSSNGPWLDFSIGPVLRYEPNINGGNPDKPLILGDLVFEGDPDYFLKSGVLVGGEIEFNGRFVYGRGRYLDLSINADLAYSPQHDLPWASLNTNICSKNHLSNWFFLDVCAGSSNLFREIHDVSYRTFSASAEKLFSSSPTLYHELKLGANRFLTGGYKQDQLSLSLNTLSQNDFSWGVSATIGENVNEKIVLDYAVEAHGSFNLFEKPLSGTFSFSQFSGEKIFGIERADKKISLGISYPVWKNLNVSASYHFSDSTIDYFDTRSLVVGVKYSPFRF